MSNPITDLVDGISSASDLNSLATALANGGIEAFSEEAADQIVAEAIEQLVGEIGSSAFGAGFNPFAQGAIIANDLERDFSVNYGDVVDIFNAEIGKITNNMQVVDDTINILHDADLISNMARMEIWAKTHELKSMEINELKNSVEVLAKEFPHLVSKVAQEIRDGDPNAFDKYKLSNVLEDWEQRVGESGNDVVWEDVYGPLDGADGGNSFGPDEWDNDDDAWPDYHYTPDHGYEGGFGNPDVDSEQNNGAWPVIIDLDGDGVEITAKNSIKFDIDGDGFVERNAWAAPDDGFLVIDLAADGSLGPGDGRIDQSSELSFAAWGEPGMTDLQALAQAVDAQGNLIFDSDGNGVLNSNDALWSSFRIFQDVNMDGFADAGELFTLDELGFTEIGLSYDDGRAYGQEEGSAEVFGSTFLGSSSYTRNGEVVSEGVGDVRLASTSEGWRYVTNADGTQSVEVQFGDEQIATSTLGRVSADLTIGADFSGGIGDQRNNSISAHGADHAVVLNGKSGNDTVTGGRGDDIIIGGSGDDLLRGGTGSDTYLFNIGDGHDTIDELMFLEYVDGVEGYSYFDGSISEDFVPANGKESGGYRWVRDSNGEQVFTSHVNTSDPANSSLGMDEVVFGEGIGIADLMFQSDNISGTDGFTRLEFDVTLRFETEDRQVNLNDSITFSNVGGSSNAFSQGTIIENLAFSSGFSIQSVAREGSLLPTGTVVVGMTGSDQSELLDYSQITTQVHNSWIFGGAGNDTIVGGQAGDFINGGLGNDVLTGSSEASGLYGDFFIFKEDDGNDTITDFNLERDRVIFDLQGESYEDLVFEDTANGALVTYDNDDTILLEGVTVSELSEDHFLFA